MNNTFSFDRFAALIKQGFIHDYKMYIMSLVGFSGGLFIVSFLFHLSQSTTILPPGTITILYILTFIVSGLLYAGAAFSGFRSKEKCIWFLMNPASRLEKFLWEYISRILLFMLVVPILFWAVYNSESRIFSVLYPSFSYQYLPFFLIPRHIPQPGGLNPYPLIISLSFFVLTVPLAGASIFNKYPLIKTLFVVSIIFFFHLFLVYFFVEVLNLKYYNISPKETQLYLLPTSEERGRMVFLHHQPRIQCAIDVNRLFQIKREGGLIWNSTITNPYSCKSPITLLTKS